MHLRSEIFPVSLFRNNWTRAQSFWRTNPRWTTVQLDFSVATQIIAKLRTWEKIKKGEKYRVQHHFAAMHNCNPAPRFGLKCCAKNIYPYGSAICPALVLHENLSQVLGG